MRPELTAVRHLCWHVWIFFLAWQLTCGTHVGGTDRSGPLRMLGSCWNGWPHAGGSCRHLTCGPEWCRPGTCVQTVVVSPYKYGSQCCRPWTVVRADTKVREQERAECGSGVSTGPKPTCCDARPLLTQQFGPPTTRDAHLCTIADV
jgi:hypothetical protein